MTYIFYVSDINLNEPNLVNSFWHFLIAYTDLRNAEIVRFANRQCLIDYLKWGKFKQVDTYYIFMDYVWEDIDSIHSYALASSIINTRSNLHLSKLLCIEYLFLTFTQSLDWFTPFHVSQQYAWLSRVIQEFISCVENTTDWRKNANILNYVNYRLQKQVSEGLVLTTKHVAELLAHDLFNGLPQDFKITKTYFGKCWKCSCCTRKQTNLCRLYVNHGTMSSSEKAASLWEITKKVAFDWYT